MNLPRTFKFGVCLISYICRVPTLNNQTVLLLIQIICSAICFFGDSFIIPDILRRNENSILTLMIMLRVKIDVTIYIEPRNGVKFFKKSVLGMRIFTRKLTRPPFRAKKNIHKYRVYGIQKNRLGNTVSTKQSVN